MVGNKGGFVEYSIAIGIILLAGIIWVVLGYSLETVTDNLDPLIQSEVLNQTVNTTSITNDIAIANNVFYFSFFVIIIVVLIWVIKKTQEEKRLV